MNQVTHKSLGQNLSLPTFGWKDESSHSRVSWSKFKSFYLQMEGRTKSLTGAVVEVKSSTTYGWKDEPSHSRVSWSKFKSSYQWEEGRTKSLTSA